MEKKRLDLYPLFIENGISKQRRMEKKKRDKRDKSLINNTLNLQTLSKCFLTLSEIPVQYVS